METIINRDYSNIIINNITKEINYEYEDCSFGESRLKKYINITLYYKEYYKEINKNFILNILKSRENFSEELKNLLEIKYISLENKQYRLEHISNSIYKDKLIYNLIYEQEN